MWPVVIPSTCCLTVSTWLGLIGLGMDSSPVSGGLLSHFQRLSLTEANGVLREPARLICYRTVLRVNRKYCFVGPIGL